MANYVDNVLINGHIWPVFKSASEIAAELGTRIRRKRIALGLTQIIAAERAGVSHRTWRRLETEGKASIDDLLRAAIALRAETEFDELFPKPVARSMDELLRQQKAMYVKSDHDKARVRWVRKS